MDDLSILATLTGVLALSVISPGPNFLIVTSTAMRVSRRAGLATAAGLALASLTWALLTEAGFALLLVPGSSAAGTVSRPRRRLFDRRRDQDGDGGAQAAASGCGRGDAGRLDLAAEGISRQHDESQVDRVLRLDPGRPDAGERADLVRRERGGDRLFGVGPLVWRPGDRLLRRSRATRLFPREDRTGVRHGPLLGGSRGPVCSSPAEADSTARGGVRAVGTWPKTCGPLRDAASPGRARPADPPRRLV